MALADTPKLGTFLISDLNIKQKHHTDHLKKRNKNVRKEW